MAQLTVDSDPRALVPGDPEAVATVAATLGRFAVGMAAGARQLRAIRAGDWSGDGGDAFRRVLGVQPGRFDTAADAFAAARRALLDYAGELRQAQADAAVVVARYRSGDENGARRLLSDAHDRVDRAARRAAAALGAAAADAPDKPGLLHRALSTVDHALTGSGNPLAHVADGVIDGVADAGLGAWALTGGAFTDRRRFVDSWVGMAGLFGPDAPRTRAAFGRSFLDWDEWSRDPDRALGHAGLDVAGLFVGGAGAAARVGRAADIADDSSLAVARLAPPDTSDFPTSRGLTSTATYAQRTFGANFSGKGGRFGQIPVTWVAEQLRNGNLPSEQVVIQVIRRGDNTLILNTRSAQALTRAGIKRSRWIVRDVTGDPRSEARLNGQLERNKLDDHGTDTVRPSPIRAERHPGNMPPPPGLIQHARRPQ